jgi:hypothetical protein
LVATWPAVAEDCQQRRSSCLAVHFVASVPLAVGVRAMADTPIKVEVTFSYGGKDVQKLLDTVLAAADITDLQHLQKYQARNGQPAKVVFQWCVARLVWR